MGRTLVLVIRRQLFELFEIETPSVKAHLKGLEISLKTEKELQTRQKHLTEIRCVDERVANKDQLPQSKIIRRKCSLIPENS